MRKLCSIVARNWIQDRWQFRIHNFNIWMDIALRSWNVSCTFKNSLEYYSFWPCEGGWKLFLYPGVQQHEFSSAVVYDTVPKYVDPLFDDQDTRGSFPHLQYWRTHGCTVSLK